MKVLWLCNIVLPELADVFGFKKENVGGWLTGVWNQLKKIDNLELAICVPVRKKNRMMDGFVNGYRYYSFQMIPGEPNTTEADQYNKFKNIIKDYNPDVIHIWGTEFVHSYIMTQVCVDLNISTKVLISIQGLLTYYEMLYEVGICEDDATRIVNGKSIRDGRKQFENRAKYEKMALNNVLHIMGRTDWDQACIKRINPKLKYHFGGAIIRDIFYTSKKWKLEKCQRYRIFMSQANYPIKGLHMVIEDLCVLAKRNPQIEIYIAGVNPLDAETAYGKYIEEKIKCSLIEGKIHFLGMLSETEMVEEYLKANVFLSASLIENESNSICEAMMIGVPIVSSFVGGLGTVLKHGVSGLLYPVNEPYLMALYLEQIFNDEELCQKLSFEGIKSAKIYNDKLTICHQFQEAYSLIADDVKRDSK